MIGRFYVFPHPDSLSQGQYLFDKAILQASRAENSPPLAPTCTGQLQGIAPPWEWGEWRWIIQKDDSSPSRLEPNRFGYHPRVYDPIPPRSDPRFR